MMARFPALATLLLTAASGALGQAGGSGGGAAADEGLHSLAVKAGKLYFGTATDTNNFRDATYTGIVKDVREFGLVVPENSMKWGNIQPRPDEFNFDPPNQVANLAKSDQRLLRCHTLVWHSQLPSFVQNGQFTKESLTKVIETHINRVMGHFKGQCYAWDVVNEAANEDGSFRNSVFFKTLGKDFIPLSFKLAAAADPAAKLYYNDFNVEFKGKKADTALSIVKLVKDAGERIDGVGFQGHFTVGKTPSRQDLATHLKRFTDLGVEVSYTELDIRHSKVPANAAARQQQATDYTSVVGACLDTPKCVGVIAWQFTDKFSWIPGTFPGAGEACLLDQNYQKTPAYTAVAELLRSAAAGGGAANRGTNRTADASALDTLDGGLSPAPISPPVPVKNEGGGDPSAPAAAPVEANEKSTAAGKAAPVAAGSSMLQPTLGGACLAMAMVAAGMLFL
ncbi:endo-1,4-beta-xylanase [Gaeumannomyces tritici R3-111a-1]|uniref:Beta-xylanase n=1 Tax=Gaeumannomyces tritici (strain R3-111a-1) TaxID=644352 RepID=J3NZ13_GAET3|nr:endo-1,4-beta-xylanase [Gaeumannomyces tritici R3-111a-1]EJT76596.1 endo-1,4-beta-xylanase [Gaeumannomyces tritici R3-111a-1]